MILLINVQNLSFQLKVLYLLYERRKKITLKWAEKLNIRGQLEDPLGTNNKLD